MKDVYHVNFNTGCEAAIVPTFEVTLSPNSTILHNQSSFERLSWADMLERLSSADNQSTILHN